MLNVSFNVQCLHVRLQALTIEETCDNCSVVVKICMSHDFASVRKHKNLSTFGCAKCEQCWLGSFWATNCARALLASIVMVHFPK